MSKTPITDAVRKAQAEDGVVAWNISIGAQCPQDEGPWRGVMEARSWNDAPEFASWEDRDDGGKYQATTNADAASALRLVADALNPDRERWALEIAANLAVCVIDMRCETSGNFDGLVLHTLAGFSGGLGGLRPEDFAEIYQEIKAVEIDADAYTDGALREWLQQAREFFEAEQATEKEKPELTIAADGRNVYRGAAGNIVLDLSVPPKEKQEDARDVSDE